MSYNDGGFYFLQPVGSGYGAVTLRNRGYGADRPSFGDEKLSVANLDAIVAKAKKHADNTYIHAGTLPVASKQRADAEKKWAKAHDAYNTVVHMRDSAKLNGVKWKVKGLPAYIRNTFGDWIKANIIAPRYPAASTAGNAFVPGAGNTTTTDRAAHRRLPAAGMALARPFSASASSAPSSAPAATPYTTPYTTPYAPSQEEVTVMGPQSVPTGAQQEAAQEQASLRQDVSDMAYSATSAPVGIMGFLSTTSGKLVAVGALAGAAYLWSRRRQGA